MPIVKRNHRQHYLGAGLVVFALSACVTSGGGGDQNAEVVERSKELSPAWVDLEAGKIHEGPTYFKYVEAGTHLLDLPLGLKQTQLSALAGSEAALRARVASRVQELAKDSGIENADSLSELDRLLTATTKDVHSRYAHVADIYFEKLERTDGPSDTPDHEFYKVYVLIQFPRANLPELISEISAKLNHSGDSSLRHLGLAVSQLSANELSH